MKRLIILTIVAVTTAALAAGTGSAQPTPPGKKWVCHKAGPNKHIVIRVSSRAVPAHLRHGDTAHETREAAQAACAAAVRVTPSRGGQKLEATLRATPTAATALGTGTFGTLTARASHGQRRFCWTLTLTLTPTQFAATGQLVPPAPPPPGTAHIHGPRPSTGIVVPLTMSAATVTALNTSLQTTGTATASGCETNVDRETIRQILSDPGSFYVNIHTTNFPGGAIEGTLSR